MSSHTGCVVRTSNTAQSTAVYMHPLLEEILCTTLEYYCRHSLIHTIELKCSCNFDKARASEQLDTNKKSCALEKLELITRNTKLFVIHCRIWNSARSSMFCPWLRCARLTVVFVYGILGGWGGAHALSLSGWMKVFELKVWNRKRTYSFGLKLSLFSTSFKISFYSFLQRSPSKSRILFFFAEDHLWPSQLPP